MVLLTAEHLKKQYGTRTIFDDISFSIHEGDKIGVIGVNGTGKSTLLRILAGEQEADSGEIITANHVQIAYLSQDVVFKEGTTILDHIFDHDNPKLKLVQAYQNALKGLEEFPEDMKRVEEVASITEAMEREQAWALHSEAKNILTKLGITNFSQTMETLSGGQRKRVAIAAALIAPVEILILDEPTNHIDHDTVEWLENHLEKYGKSLIMVTHDRYFLDRVANRMIELDQGKLYPYEGNYTKFLELKAQREELEARGEQKRQSMLKSELEWVRKGAKARTTKQKARLQRFDELSNQEAPEEKKRVELSSVGSRLGKKTIVLENISKAYHEITYIKDFSYILLKEDRIGITGKNGMGKSTLVNLIVGNILPDAGMIERGETVKIGVFAQENTEIDETQSVLDYMREEAEFLETEKGSISASQMLEKFLFPPDMQRGPISMLSGGEKRRLYLARILLNAPNILILDEPTNDLDIETLLILEEYLESFRGAVVVVSHDRYFLDKVVGRIFAFLGDGIIKQYEGGYSDYKEAYEKEKPFLEEEVVTQEAQKQEASAPKQNIQKAVKKMSYKDKREYDTIGDEIAKLENQLDSLENEMEACITDYTKLQELSKEKEDLQLHLEARMERWLELMELAEEIEKNTK